MSASVRMTGVGKRYVKYDDIPLLLTRAFRFRAGNRRTHLWALRDIDLTVDAGESFGVIGRNGSGKSTMFRMLAGVTAPTEGVVAVQGRVAPLISVGIGFHPELTGRENVYVNGTILGMTRKEIDDRFDSILAFSEIEEFIDTPVKFYSSGMFVRLGFAVAVAADPEVLLVDEVLAVGDLQFQMRCFDRMEDIRRQGSTVLVVSHNMNAIRRLCSRTMLIHEGKHMFTGETDEAVGMYNDLLGQINLAGSGESIPECEVLDFSVLGARGTFSAHIRSGEDLTFRMLVQFHADAERPAFGVRIHKDSGTEVYSENTALTDLGSVKAGETVQVDIKVKATFPTGSYIVKGSAFMGGHEDARRAHGDPLSVFVSGRPFVKGTTDLAARFEVSKLELPTDSSPARISPPAAAH